MFARETLAGVPLLFNKTRRRRAICKANRRGTNKKRTSTWMSSFYCEDKTIEMFLRFRCLDLNTRHNHSTSLRFCFQGCLQRHLDFSLQRHLDFSAADKDHLDFLF